MWSSYHAVSLVFGLLGTAGSFTGYQRQDLGPKSSTTMVPNTSRFQENTLTNQTQDLKSAAWSSSQALSIVWGLSGTTGSLSGHQRPDLDPKGLDYNGPQYFTLSNKKCPIH